MHTVTKTTCIDFHAHALPQSFRDAIAELGIDPIAEDGFPFPAWNAEAHLQFMAEAGISRALLSAIPASIRLWKSGTGEKRLRSFIRAGRACVRNSRVDGHDGSG